MDFAIRLPIAKRIDAGGTLKIFGFGSVVAEGGSLVVDHHRDVIEPAELERAAYEFTAAARKLDVSHDREPVGDLIESLYLSPEKLDAMGLSDGGKGLHAWWTGFEVRDPETIARVKSGELPMMSVDITCERHVLAEDQTAERIEKRKSAMPSDTTPEIGRLRKLRVRLLSLVGEGANPGAHVCLVKTKEKPIMPTLESIMAKLSPEEQAALSEMLSKAAPKAEPKAADGAETPAAKELRKQLEDRDERMKALDAEVTKLRDERALEVEIAKAKADGLEYVAGASIEDLAKMRLAVRKALPAHAEKLDAVLKSAAEAIKTSEVLVPRGRKSAAGDAEPQTFDALYEREKAANPKEEPTAIFARLAKARPDLYRTRNERS